MPMEDGISPVRFSVLFFRGYCEKEKITRAKKRIPKDVVKKLCGNCG
jgi:hypothetical protein